MIYGAVIAFIAAVGYFFKNYFQMKNQIGNQKAEADYENEKRFVITEAKTLSDIDLDKLVSDIVSNDKSKRK